VNQTEVIFLGTVLKAGNTEFGPYRFSVDEAFKGIEKETKELDIQGSHCVAGYLQGKQYLILGTRREANGPISSGDCTGSIPLEYAADALVFMRDWAEGKRQQILQGRIGENVDDFMVRYYLDSEHRKGMAGVEIIATQGDAEFRGTTDEQGRYRVVVPKAGSYRVTAKLNGYSPSQSEYTANVEAASCSEQNIGMWTDSHISGTIYWENGKPARDIPVQIIRAACEDCLPREPVKTDAKGRYEFQKIPRGEYIVGVNVTGLNSKNPYAPRFYPGVEKIEDATRIVVSGPKSLANLDFKIADRLPTRTIEAIIAWSDGRPVINASVDCSSQVSTDRLWIADWVSVDVDENGRAVCEVLTDRHFTVEADRLSWSGSSPPVLPIEARQKLLIPAGKENVAVRIVVDIQNDMSATEKPVGRSKP